MPNDQDIIKASEAYTQALIAHNKAKQLADKYQLEAQKTQKAVSMAFNELIAMRYNN